MRLNDTLSNGFQFVQSLLWKSQLRRNASSGVFVAIGNLVLVLASYPIYLTYLGAEWYGLWATLSIVIVMGQMGNLGVHIAVARHVAEAFGRGDIDDVWKFIGASLILMLPPCLFVIFICVAFKSAITGLLGLDGSFAEVAQTILPWIGGLSALILCVEVLKGIVVGVGQMALANYIFISTRGIQFSVSVAFLFAGQGVVSLLYGAAAAYILMGIGYTLYILLRVERPVSGVRAFSKPHVRTLLGFGAYMASSSLVSILMDPFNKIILARYFGLETVTFYEIGLKGVQMVRTVFEMAVKAIMPRVSELSSRGADAIGAIRKVHNQSVRYVLVVGIPIFVALFVLGDLILKVWIGDQFSGQMTSVLRWYSVGYLVNLMSVPAFYVLVGLNGAKYCFYAAVFRSMVHFLVVSCLLLFGVGVSVNVIVGVHVFAMMGAALLIIMMYLRVTDRMSIAPAEKGLETALSGGDRYD